MESIEVETQSSQENNEIIMNRTLDYEIIEREILQLESEIKSEENSNLTMRICFVPLLLVSIFAYLKVIEINIYFNVFLTFISLLMIAVSFSKSKINKLEANLKLAKRKKDWLQMDNNGIKSQYFDSLVGINIKNLEDYYTLVKDSNKKSFYTSLIISITGMIFIGIGIGIGFFNKELQDISYMATASGVLIELVTALLFYLYNKSVIQLKEYHSSLLDVQNVLLSFKLIGDIREESSKLDAMKQMMEYLVKKK